MSKPVDTRKNKIESLREHLKNTFFSMEEPIDQIVDTIKSWYIHPELNQQRQRPLILNLVGVTGVSKTTMVKEIVNYLDLTKQFINIEFGIENRYHYSGNKENRHIVSTLRDEDVTSWERGVLLLDELHRFKTIDRHGDDVGKESTYSDIWEFLSVGKARVFNSNEIDSLSGYFDDIDYEYNNYDVDKYKSEPITPEKKHAGKLRAVLSGIRHSSYQVGLFKSFITHFKLLPGVKLGGKSSVKHMVVDFLANKDKYYQALEGVINKEVNYNHLLIITSMNLDSAYWFLDNDNDVDPDNTHKLSKLVTVDTVTNAMYDLFKPEQVSRLVSNIVIFPTINSLGYEQLYTKMVNQVTDVYPNLKFDNSVLQFYKRNFIKVYQGARPSLSGLDTIKLTTMEAVFDLVGGVKNRVIDVKYDDRNYLFTVETRTKSWSKVWKGELDSIRNNFNEDDLYSIAVHEAGHCVLVALLHGYVPNMITCGTASSNGSGINYLPSFSLTKEYVEKHIKVLFGGHIAERLVFGDDNLTPGSSSDIRSATKLLTNAYRYQGLFDNYTSQVHFNRHNRVETTEQDDNLIKQKIDTLYESARDTLSNPNNLQIVGVVASELVTKRRLTSSILKELIQPFLTEELHETGVEDKTIYPKFKEMFFNKFTKH